VPFVSKISREENNLPSSQRKVVFPYTKITKRLRNIIHSTVEVNSDRHMFYAGWWQRLPWKREWHCPKGRENCDLGFESHSNHRRTLCIYRYHMVGWSYVQGFPPDIYKRESHKHRKGSPGAHWLVGTCRHSNVMSTLWTWCGVKPESSCITIIPPMLQTHKPSIYHRQHAILIKWQLL
jgi:hypothetical protein